MTRKILIDTDCGVDDAEALLLALSKDSDIEVVAITCVNGNAPLRLVWGNVLRVLKVVGRTDVGFLVFCGFVCVLQQATSTVGCLLITLVAGKKVSF